MQPKKLVLVTLASILAFSSLASAQLMRKPVDVDGVMRQYLMYLPAGYDGTSQFPVMLAYHGGGGNALWMLLMADMRSLADAHDFILVYPQGLPDDAGDPIWNSEGPFSNGVDELGYTAALIDSLAAEYEIDQSRVYATGYSNGANMVWELACLLSDRITAVGAVAGSNWRWIDLMCSPTRPVPVLSIHGTLDFYNPYNGGFFSLGLIEASEYWVEVAGADATPEVVALPDTVPGDGSTVEQYTWANGENCVSVEHYKVLGGGHDWPGTFGNMDIDSNEVIWGFVSQFDHSGKIGCSD